MIIHGIQKLTLLDYPEHTACILFTGACSFHCPFCQNGSLVLHPELEPVIDLDQIFKFLLKRKHILQGVCISGGEPTLQPDLKEFIQEVKSIGYNVKLDTNGYQPDVLRDLLDSDLLDAVAMDIKSSPRNYAKAAGISEDIFDFSRIQKSVNLILSYNETHPDFYYEFRTTVVKTLHTQEDMKEIGQWLYGVNRYYLQRYIESDSVIDKSMKSFSDEEMKVFKRTINRYIDNADIR